MPNCATVLGYPISKPPITCANSGSNSHLVGHGDWDFITEENVNDAMEMLREAVLYCVALPARIKEHVAQRNKSES